MLQERNLLMVFFSLFVLSACGMSDETAETNTQVDVKKEAEQISEETNSEILEDQEDTSLEEEIDSEQEKISEEPPTEETNTTTQEPDFQWIYDELNGKSFIFSSGAGAWRTSFTFTDNGQFSGTFSDADGAEIAVSEFSGQFDIDEEIDEYTYQLKLGAFEVTSDTGTEEADGDMTITYVEGPHGFQSGSDTFELYLPYKPKNDVSDEYLSWVSEQANNDYDFLNSFGLYNITHEFGMEEMLD